jgi:hypothetical protein
MKAISAPIVCSLLTFVSVAVAAEPDPKAGGLTATLTSAKDSYVLNPAQSGEEFRKSLKELDRAPRGAPPAPAVALSLEIKNPTDQAIVISLGGDESQVTFKLTGEGAVTVANNVAMTMEFRSGTPTTIGPGKSHTIPLTSLAGGSRGIAQMSYFTEAGEYKLSATLTAACGEKQVVVTSEPITIKVVKK